MAGTVPLYFVTDLAKTQAYYSEVLGFKVESVFTDPDGGEEVVWSSLTYGEAGIMLAAFQVAGQEAEIDQLGLGVWAYIEVEDADEYYQEVSRRGARIVKPVCTMDYGLREFRVQDPDGYILVFYHSLQAE